jgi:hypothetical protein
MKLSCLLIASLTLIFTGCSSIYKVSNFPSRDKFYKDFNKSANDKTLRVTLTNDSSFITENGAQISNDSIIFITKVRKEEKISRNDIMDIKYTGTDMENLLAVIYLKNGYSTTVKISGMLPDSSISVIVLENKNEFLPVNMIKKISYKNNLLGGVLGFVYGVPLGFISGITLYGLTSPPTGPPGSGGPNDHAADNLLELSFFSVPVISAIIGSIHGYTYTYIFNP